MARINIEDDIYKDNRFIELCISCGDQEKAYGALFRMWMVAQKYYLSHKEIPREVWVKQSLNNKLIECGLAEHTSTGVRAKGQDEQFSWLLDAQAKGKASAAKRRQLQGNAIPKKATNEIRTAVRPDPDFSEPLCTSLFLRHGSGEPLFSPEGSCSSLLGYSSTSLSKDKSTTRTSSKTSSLEKKDNTHLLIGIFCREYKRRYETTYRITGKEIAALKRLYVDLGHLHFENTIAAYLNMPDPWFVTRRHDVITLESNLAKVTQFEQSGRLITQTQIRELDRRSTNQELIAAAERGEI